MKEHFPLLVASCVGLFFGGSTSASATEVKREIFGRLADGTEVEAITLEAANGVSARILTYGATLQSVIVPDATGHEAEVTLGYDDLASYVDHPNYFGVTIGRYANRIANGRFILDGNTYQVPQNLGTSSLHGGDKGFDKVLWRVTLVESGPIARLVMTHTSPDGDSGYPGTLVTTVTYTLDEQGSLGIVFDAETDRPTVVNLTNHAVFNLAGDGSQDGAMGHLLMIPASAYTVVSEDQVPTGESRPVAGTAFDFRLPRRVSDGIRNGREQQIVYGHGYDVNFVLDKGLTATPELAARLVDPASGRVMEVLTTEPGLELYAGNGLNGTVIGRGGTLYRMGDGIALEPEKFPDAPNHPNFISARIDPGQPYHHAMIYRFSVVP